MQDDKEITIKYKNKEYTIEEFLKANIVLNISEEYDGLYNGLN